MKNIGINSYLPISNGLIRSMQTGLEIVSNCRFKNIGKISRRLESLINQPRQILKPNNQIVQARHLDFMIDNKLLRVRSGDSMLRQSGVNFSNIQFKSIPNQILEKTETKPQGSSSSDLKNLEIPSLRREEAVNNIDLIKNLHDPILIVDPFRVVADQKIFLDSSASDPHKSPAPYLKVWQDEEQQQIDLKYQSKSRGEQVLELKLDQQGNLTLRVNQSSDCNWWIAQKQYLQSALRQLGYQSFTMQTKLNQNE